MRGGALDANLLAVGQPAIGHGGQQVQFVAALVDQHVPEHHGVVRRPGHVRNRVAPGEAPLVEDALRERRARPSSAAGTSRSPRPPARPRRAPARPSWCRPTCRDGSRRACPSHWIVPSMNPPPCTLRAWSIVAATRGSSRAKSSVGQSVSVLPQCVPSFSQLGGKWATPVRLQAASIAARYAAASARQRVGLAGLAQRRAPRRPCRAARGGSTGRSRRCGACRPRGTRRRPGPRAAGRRRANRPAPRGGPSRSTPTARRICG